MKFLVCTDQQANLAKLMGRHWDKNSMSVERAEMRFGNSSAHVHLDSSATGWNAFVRSQRPSSLFGKEKSRRYRRASFGRTKKRSLNDGNQNKGSSWNLEEVLAWRKGSLNGERIRRGEKEKDGGREREKKKREEGERKIETRERERWKVADDSFKRCLEDSSKR